MANRKLQSRNSIKSLKGKLKAKEYLEIRDRIRAVVFALKGNTDREISERLDYSLGWVKKWIANFNKNGFDGLYDGIRTGAPAFLTDLQIADLYDDILAGPDPDGILSRYRISDLVQLVQKRFGVKYSHSGMHALMKRMKLSHVKPRPQHPKNDPAAMNSWKKKPNSSSKSKLGSTPIRKSKSGIRTKHDLAKKGS
jgi:transposase